MADNTNSNKKGNRYAFQIIRIVLIVVFASIAVFSGYKIIVSFMENKKSIGVYDPIKDSIENLINQTDENGETDSRVVVWSRGEDGSSSEPAEITVTDNITDPDNSKTNNDESSNKEEPTDTHGSVPPDTVDTSETEIITLPPETGDDIIPSQSHMFSQMKKYIKMLQLENSDVIGIIYIPITMGNISKTISYPILKTDNNDFYLTHDYRKQPLASGSIFADMNNSNNVADNKNLVLYGHNMFAGNMFHSLSDLLNSKEAFNSTYVYVFTTEAIYVYELFSVYKTSADDNYCQISFAKDSDFYRFVYGAEQKSAYHKGLEFYSSDRLITLSTCYGIPGGSGRLAVHGLLVKIER